MRVRTIVSWTLILSGLLGGLLSTSLRISGGADVVIVIFDILPGLVGMALAATLVLRAPENRMSLVVSLTMATGFNFDLLAPVVDRALDMDRIAAAVVFTHLSNLIFVVFFLLLVVFIPLWFPTGHAIGQRWERVWHIAAAAAAMAGLGSFFAGETCVRTLDNINCEQWVETPWGLQGLTEATFTPLIIVAFLMAAPAFLSLVSRFRRSAGAERQQLRWLVFSVSPLAPLFFFQAIGSELFGWDVQWVQVVFNAVVFAMLVSIGLAVLKYRLYDIDRIISRTVSYAAIVGLLGVVFAAGVVFIPNAVPGLEDSTLLVAVSTLAVAALFNPLRQRVQRAVDRRFNRSRFDAERVMRGFAGSLQDRIDPEAVIGGWMGVVTETMQPEGVSVWVRG